MAETFDTNVLRAAAASLSCLVSMTVAREMFAKGYFELGVQERAIVDDSTFQMTAARFQQLTPENLSKSPGSMGFQPPTNAKTP